MKVLTANIALGLKDMDRLANNMRGIAAYHSWRSFLVAIAYPPLRGRWSGPSHSRKRIEYLRRHENLEATIALVSASSPDILILNEVVPEVHKRKFDSALKEMGFAVIAYGLGGKYPDAHGSTLVATRKEAKEIMVRMPQPPYPGCGGGIAGLRLKDGISVIGAHMGFGGTELWRMQLAAIAAGIEKEQALGNRVIFAGDCNETEKHMDAAFSKLGLVSADHQKSPTCPTSLPRIFQKSLDHIYIPNTSLAQGFRTIPFGSDHLALSVEVSM